MFSDSLMCLELSVASSSAASVVSQTNSFLDEYSLCVASSSAADVFFLQQGNSLIGFTYFKCFCPLEVLMLKVH